MINFMLSCQLELSLKKKFKTSGTNSPELIRKGIVISDNLDAQSLDGHLLLIVGLGLQAVFFYLACNESIIQFPFVQLER